MDVVLTADIGGTKLAVGLVRADGSVLASYSEATPRGSGAEALYRRFGELLWETLRRGRIKGEAACAIGVGCGGPMLLPDGIVSPLNIPAWRDFPLRSRLEEDFKLPALVDNDAKAFALGESWVGTGRGARCLLAMVVSTGVGAGVVQDGRLIDGARGNAGHIGHVLVSPSGPRCPCGARGCLEASASGTSLGQHARAAIARGASSRIPAEPGAREVAIAAAAGDKLALSLFRRAGVALGRGIASAAALFDLDRVVIGGGVANSAEFFLAALRRELDARARLEFTRNLPVEISSGTINAALAGAARLALASRRQSD